MTRKQITTRGQYGSTVNVFADTLGGEPVVRCEWRETDPFGRKSRKTETFRGPKRDAERQAKAFAEDVATRLRKRELAALTERAVRLRRERSANARGGNPVGVEYLLESIADALSAHAHGLLRDLPFIDSDMPVLDRLREGHAAWCEALATLEQRCASNAEPCGSEP